MIESLTDRIKRHEGFTLNPKPDAKGYYVIGYGHDIPESEASNYVDGCTEEQAENLLSSDIQRATDEVNSALPWVNGLDEIRQEVLIEMAFQIGLSGLLGFHNALASCQSGHYDIAAACMLNSLWHEQTPERAEELANLMITGGSDD